MASNRFFGKVGYSEGTVEVRRGVHEEQIVEFPYYGDVRRNSRDLDVSEKVNPDTRVGNSISIVADAYANEHFFAIRYVEWQGVRWVVSNVLVEPPRLLLRLGGVYNGRTPLPAPVESEGGTP